MVYVTPPPAGAVWEADHLPAWREVCERLEGLGEGAEGLTVSSSEEGMELGGGGSCPALWWQRSVPGGQGVFE